MHYRALAEIYHREPCFPNGIGRRRLLAIMEQPDPEDHLAANDRRILFQH